jgi:hypothetical protein
MNDFVARTLYWTPRALCIAFALFISLFALDVFDGPAPIGEKLVALAIHLVPTALVVLLLALAWRREWVGAVAFIGLGLVYAAWAWSHPLWILAIGGPLFLLGGLFFAGWIVRRQAAPGPAA